MDFMDRISEMENRKEEAKERLFREPTIEDLGKKFDLEEVVEDAAVLIFRLFVGLGKGLSSSQKRSFSAVSVWYSKKLIEREEIEKKQLAEAVNLSPRTLTRRFKGLEDDEDSKIVLDFVKHRIRKWSKRRDYKLKEWL
ncbi:MAG: hypothetical protein ACLFUR_04435 [Candidatus Hadarchaeia archaeon]